MTGSTKNRLTWKGLASRWVTSNEDGSVFTCRKGTIRFADGTKHKALLDFCESDSNEHYGMAVLIADPEGFDDAAESFADQESDDFLQKLGKTSEEVFPYRYTYEGPQCRDHHIGEDGWSR